MIETRFKDTEIGRIPDDWDIKSLRDSFEFLSNNTLSRENLGDDGRIRNIHYGDVLIAYGAHVDVEKDFIPAILDTNFCAKNFAKNGDIIIADTAEDETVGKAVEVTNIGKVQIVSGLHTMWIRPKIDDKFHIGYLGYAFNASLFHNQLFPLMQGTKVTSVSKTAIKDTYIAVPPKKEQSSITSALVTIDNLISSFDKLIEKKKNIKQGTMQQLLTGKKRLKGFSEPWVERTLNEIGNLGAGGTPSTFNLSYWNGNVNWLQSGAVQNCIIHIDAVKQRISDDGLSHSAAYLMPAGSILIAITGATCANIGYLTFESSANQSVVGLTCNSNSCGEFIYQKLLTERENILSFKGGSAQSGVSLSNLRKLTIKMPYSKAEQIAIASVLTSMDNEISALEAKKAKYEFLKQGMMQQLLTGKIRLV